MDYLKKIIRTGAVRKTPKRIIQKICQEVSLREHATIIEVGAGKGEITTALLAHVNKADYYAFEIDPEFTVQLQASFPNIHVINHNALEFHEVASVPPFVDYFISSIPLSFFKQAEVELFCRQIYDHVKSGGKIIILFSAFWLIPTLKNALPGIRIEPFATLPPYFLAVFKKIDRNN